MRSRLLALLLTVALTACTLSAQPPPAAPPPAPVATLPPVVPSVRETVRAELAADRPLEALLLLSREVKGGQKETFFAAEYPLALNAVLARAERHRLAQRPGEAGELLRYALDAWPKSPMITHRLDRSAEAVTADLQQCADRLMDLGLVEYRGGRLESAIAYWQQTLAIDPSHTAARQALETASRQLKNLRALD